MRIRKLLVAAIFIAPLACAQADMLDFINDVANSIIDEPIDTYVKGVAAKREGVNTANLPTFMFESATVHVSHIAVVTADEPEEYTCSSVTSPDKVEYRMAVLNDVDGDYYSVMEGEAFYLAMCAPHTDQGKIELKVLELTKQAKKLYEDMKNIH